MYYLRTELCQTFDPGLEDVVYLHSEKGDKTECRADDKQLLTVAKAKKKKKNEAINVLHDEKALSWCL